MTDEAETQRQEEWLAGMREVVRFYEEHRDLIPESGFDLTDYTGDDERGRAVAYARALGNCSKDWSDSLLRVVSAGSRFGPHKVRYVANRSAVCTKTVTEVEEEVTERDPAIVAQRLADVPEVTRTVTARS